MTTESAVQVFVPCGVSTSTVREWMRRGYLRRYHAGRLLRVREDELRRFLEAADKDLEEASSEKIAEEILSRLPD